MNDKRYMETIWNKVRWHEWERYQKEEAERINKLIKKEERKVKLSLFGVLSIVSILLIILLNFNTSIIFIEGFIILIVAIYYENIIEMEIIRRIKDENNY